MTEPKQATYQVIDDENNVIYTTNNLDKAIGVAEYVKETDEVKCKISQVILV